MSCADPEDFFNFLLNPATQPGVIAIAQRHGRGIVDQACHLARTWLYTLHRARLELLNFWDN